MAEAQAARHSRRGDIMDAIEIDPDEIEVIKPDGTRCRKPDNNNGGCGCGCLIYIILIYVFFRGCQAIIGG